MSKADEFKKKLMLDEIAFTAFAEKMTARKY